MQTKLYIFDLDDTLVRYGKHKFCVPKQTFHMLRRLHNEGHKIVIITYNPLGTNLVKLTKLNKYVKEVVYGTEYRHLLLYKFLQSYDDIFTYVDDRKDNIQCIKEHYPNATTVHVANPLLLYKLMLDLKRE